MVEKAKYTTDEQNQFMSDIAEHFNSDIVTKRQINEYVKEKGIAYPTFIFSKKYEVSFGKYRVRDTQTVETQIVQETAIVPQTQERVFSRKLAANITDNLVPNKDRTYVPFGFYNDLKMIIKSKIFYPVYITGLSGNGKTVMVEQICANTDREMVRVNITKETDETDLIGSYELIDGNTVRREGPVVTAMRKGAILLLDETDYGSERLLCLQPILEGKPYLDKKTGEVITPTEGFNIIATANTKGKGSDDGRFIGANVLNEAFLERFAITVEQEYPTAAVEKQILAKNFTEYNIVDPKFIDILVNWAEMVRKTYVDGGVTEIISTRRLVHITKAYSIFKNRMKAIELCLNRFDEDHKRAFLDAYEKVDDSSQEVATPDSSSDGFVPFDPESVKKAVGGSFFAATTGAAPTGAPPPMTPNKKMPNAGVAPAAFQASAIKFMPAFASATVQFETSKKFNERIKISFDATTKDWVVGTHGFESRISEFVANSAKEKSPGEWLNLLIAANMAKKEGKVQVDYRPIQ
jgi:hypothetical protein